MLGPGLSISFLILTRGFKVSLRADLAIFILYDEVLRFHRTGVDYGGVDAVGGLGRHQDQRRARCCEDDAGEFPAASSGFQFVETGGQDL